MDDMLNKLNILPLYKLNATSVDPGQKLIIDDERWVRIEITNHYDPSELVVWYDSAEKSFKFGEILDVVNCYNYQLISYLLYRFL